MKIPKEIKIGYKNYKVEIVEPDEGKLYLDGNLCYGTINYDNELIRLNSNFPKNHNQTFIHELLHGICEMQSLDEINDNEDYIDRLAKEIYQVIVDNNLKIKKK